jgi:glutamyl-tRNA synthetase
MPVAELAPYVRKTLEAAGLHPPSDEATLLHILDVIRPRFFTLTDFVIRGRAYFADDFDIEPKAVQNLDAPGARELLRELGDRLSRNGDFTEQSVETEVRKLAADKGVKAGVIINASRAALTGQAVGPSAFTVFACIGRDRAIARLRNV